MISITLNGKKKEIKEDITLTRLLEELEINERAIALELNQNIIPRGEFSDMYIKEGDRIEILHIIGGGGANAMEDKEFIIAGKKFTSRLFVGTGKYSSMEVMQKALEASGAEVVTVAVRRLDLDNPKENLLEYIDRSSFVILPNTAGAYTPEEAVRIAHLSKAIGLSNMVKLEVIGDEKTLLPDVEGLLEATKILANEGFVVLPYTNDDPVTAKKLVEAGASAVMPLAAPIGSGQGILNPLNIELIMEAVQVPVIVDAGVGTASDAALAMELGVDGVLMNTGIALARDPVLMAKAMRDAVTAGRLAYLAGRIPKKKYASASSPPLE